MSNVKVLILQYHFGSGDRHPEISTASITLQSTDSSVIELASLRNTGVAAGISLLSHLQPEIKYFRFGSHHLKLPTSVTPKSTYSRPVTLELMGLKNTGLAGGISRESHLCADISTAI